MNNIHIKLRGSIRPAHAPRAHRVRYLNNFSGRWSTGRGVVEGTWGALRRYHSPGLALDERAYGTTPVPAPRAHRGRYSPEMNYIHMSNENKNQRSQHAPKLRLFGGGRRATTIISLRATVQVAGEGGLG